MRSSRREFLEQSANGFGGVVAAWMLHREAQAADAGSPAADGHSGGVGRHHPAKAQRVVQLFMSGGASQCDTFDYKPELIRRNGQPWDPGEKVTLFQSQPGMTMASPWTWSRYGQCGKYLTDIVSPLGPCVDDIAFVHNVVARSNVHGPATFMQGTGFVLPGFPSVGSWVSYGLGSIVENLPTFVVLPDPRGFAPNGPSNWSAGFLPAAHQGTMIRADRDTPLANLYPPAGADGISITPESDRATFAALKKLNQVHAASRPWDSRLDARIRAYEMAAQLQLSAPEALDLSQETMATLSMYGLTPETARHASREEGISKSVEVEHFGRNCLVARRLLERGVRFVQIWSGADNGHPRRNWDSHEDIRRDHEPLAWGMSVGAAALLRDLKQRGMLDDTLVLWTTEFGRMPCGQGDKGRDHNPFVFTNWLAGGGIRGGTTYGESDLWSFRPQEGSQATYCYDIHATMLHLLGIDHERLTVRHNGIDRRLTDVHGRVIREIIS